MSTLTPFQTVGPYLSLGLRDGAGALPSSFGGSRVTIRGRLLDGQQQGIPDGVLEWWHPTVGVLQRSLTCADGSFVLNTVRPGAVPGPGDRLQAPHFAIRVLGRGILTQYLTRMYFPDEPDTATDPILMRVPEGRRPTLIARRVAAGEYQFDVTVQGWNETVFFDF